MLNQRADGRMNFEEEEDYHEGLTLRVARGVYKNVDKMSPLQLEALIAMMNREIEGLHTLMKEGSIPPSDLDFYVKPIEGRIKLVQDLIDEQRKIAAIKLVGLHVNP